MSTATWGAVASARTAFTLRELSNKEVNSFLQHALLVPQNHFRADFNQALEALLP
jgi:hypothetical protein